MRNAFQASSIDLLKCRMPRTFSRDKTVSRFWTKVNKTPTCWLWMSPLSNKGYGVFWNHTAATPAHRFSYELMRGGIENGMQLDHLCRVRHCVNPAHLELVTDAENVLRGIGPTAINARKSKCIRGHEFSGVGTQGFRVCNKCKAITARIRYRLRKFRGH